MDIPERVTIRALSHVRADPATGCLLSTYSVGSHGYAQIGWQVGSERFLTLVHRVVWVAAYGPIPDGMTVDHKCKERHSRRCMNHNHLRLLTNFENARRTSGRDWPLGQCLHGHPNSELRQWGKRRRCRVCLNAVQRENRRRRKAAGHA